MHAHQFMFCSCLLCYPDLGKKGRNDDISNLVNFRFFFFCGFGRGLLPYFEVSWFHIDQTYTLLNLLNQSSYLNQSPLLGKTVLTFSLLQLQKENQLYKSNIMVTAGANQVTGTGFLFFDFEKCT